MENLGFDPIQPYFVLGADSYLKRIETNSPVAHFYRFDNKRQTVACSVVPDGSTDLIFTCDKNHPKAVVAGTVEAAGGNIFKENVTYFGVRLMPGISDHFAGISTKELIGISADLRDVIGGSDLIESICLSDSFDEQIARFNTGIAPFIDSSGGEAASPVVMEILSEIFAAEGNIHISQLEQNLHYSRRHLSRIFLNYTGMDMKHFCMIIRFQSVLTKINHGVYRTIADTALDNGYYDQTHFQKDFRRFTDMTPKAYQKLIDASNYFNRIKIV